MNDIRILLLTYLPECWDWEGEEAGRDASGLWLDTVEPRIGIRGIETCN